MSFELEHERDEPKGGAGQGAVAVTRTRLPSRAARTLPIA